MADVLPEAAPVQAGADAAMAAVVAEQQQQGRVCTPDDPRGDGSPPMTDGTINFPPLPGFDDAGQGDAEGVDSQKNKMGEKAKVAGQQGKPPEDGNHGEGGNPSNNTPPGAPPPASDGGTHPPAGQGGHGGGGPAEGQPNGPQTGVCTPEDPYGNGQPPMGPIEGMPILPFHPVPRQSEGHGH